VDFIIDNVRPSVSTNRELTGSLFIASIIKQFKIKLHYYGQHIMFTFHTKVLLINPIYLERNSNRDLLVRLHFFLLPEYKFYFNNMIGIAESINNCVK
jgi:hypothetical protein